MINRICGKCKSHKVVDLGSYAGSSFYKCEDCEQVGMRDKFPEMTLFDKITVSTEVLAKKLVYQFIGYDSNGLFNGYWKSTITDEDYTTKEEAITATVERLKEEVRR